MKIAMLFFALIGSAVAQIPSGSITGVVRDPSGAAVPGARVRVVNLATNLARAGTTSGQGDYSFSVLLPGEYEVNVQAEQFQPMVLRASVEAGTATVADFDLRLGDLNESITVEGNSPQIRYDSHTVSGLIIGSQIEGLPLNGRSFLELAKLQPGVQPPSLAVNNR